MGESTMPDMLADGSNPEGVDPEPALGWKNKDDLQNVSFYGVAASPPCCKIRVYLHHGKIPFTFEVGTNKPGSDYKKMPVLQVGNRQVNDSWIILKNLIPAVLPDLNFDEAFEEKMCF